MQPTRPLQGLRVIDLTQMAAGPFCTMLFADAGADVIKIERPATGDLMREFGPFRAGLESTRIGGGVLRFSRNKRSLALDLRNPAGQDLLRELVKHADVVWENYAPGTMERFGLGYAQLREVNPRIIYAAISGFGHADIYESPYGRRAAYDLIAQALSGLMDITGQRDGPPTAVGTIIGDLVPGLYCTIGVLMALRMREITGQGQLVDVAMYDAMAALCERPAMTYAVTGEATSRGGEVIAGPYDIYRARDGYVAIAAAPITSWTSLCKAIEREDLLSDPRLATPGDRARRNEEVLRPVLEGWLADRSKVEASDYLGERGVAAAPVQTVAEMMACPHIAARRMVLTMEHPVVGPVRMMGNPVKMSAVPEPEARRVPDVGEHTEDILREVLGYDAARIAAVRSSGAVG